MFATINLSFYRKQKSKKTIRRTLDGSISQTLVTQLTNAPYENSEYDAIDTPSKDVECAEYRRAWFILDKNSWQRKYQVRRWKRTAICPEISRSGQLPRAAICYGSTRPYL